VGGLDKGKGGALRRERGDGGGEEGKMRRGGVRGEAGEGQARMGGAEGSRMKADQGRWRGMAMERGEDRWGRGEERGKRGE